MQIYYTSQEMYTQHAHHCGLFSYVFRPSDFIALEAILRKITNVQVAVK